MLPYLKRRMEGHTNPRKRRKLTSSRDVLPSHFQVQPTLIFTGKDFGIRSTTERFTSGSDNCQSTSSIIKPKEEGSRTGSPPWQQRKEWQLHVRTWREFDASMLTNNSSAGNYLTLPNEVAGAPQSLMPSQSTNSTQNAFSGGIGTDVSESLLYEELWHACAGPFVTLPRIGERAFHFPQGHIKQVDASTNQGVDKHMPLYNIPSKILCHVIDVQSQAEPETDEVFLQITLFP